MTVTLRYWTSDKDFLRTKIDLVGSVKKRFDEKGLSFSAPQPA